MSEIKCPTCGSRKFFVKDPDDEYETYEFECRGDRIHPDAAADGEDPPAIDADTETFCDTCAWHGAFGTLKPS